MTYRERVEAVLPMVRAFLDGEGFEGEENRWCVVQEGSGYVIAMVHNGAPGDSLETEAVNARLLAAAPRLLRERDALRARLEGVKVWLEQTHVNMGDEGAVMEHAEIVKVLEETTI